MRVWFGILAAAMALGLAGGASAADQNTLKNLHAPPPFAAAMLPPGKSRPVKLVRVVVQLPPEPWAFMRIDGHMNSDLKVVYGEDRLLTWTEGQREMNLPTLSAMFAEEMERAGGAPDRASESLFDQDSSADLQLGARVTEMQGRFCHYCGRIGANPRWEGAVVMTARWEIYSTLERRVIATIETHGGFNAPDKGVEGDPQILINEAFRDNVRRLIGSDEFRRVITASNALPTGASPGIAPISLTGPRQPTGVAQAAKSVAIIYAADGQGSGFLVSRDGYVLTNQHVVGGSKYVKLKWPNGAETLGEVVRADRRRDVALIKTEAQGRAPLALRPGPVQQGETVFAIGTPLDDALQNTMTKGIISAERTEQGLRLIQSDAAINHGNSGGPLIDDRGAVVAIAVSGILPDSHQMGLNFFIPIDDALKVLALTPVAVAEAPVVKPAPPRARKPH